MRLAISDSHEGLKGAICQVLGCPWQRCCVHFVRDMHQHCRPAQRGMVSAALREIFTAESYEAAKERTGVVLERLSGPVPKVAQSAGGRRGGPALLLRLPVRPLVQASKHQPLGAGQP